MMHVISALSRQAGGLLVMCRQFACSNTMKALPQESFCLLLISDAAAAADAGCSCYGTCQIREGVTFLQEISRFTQVPGLSVP